MPVQDVVDVATLGIRPTNSPRENSDNARKAQLDLPANGGQKWLFGGMEYSFAEPLRVFRRLWLEGPSGGMNTPQTKLSFPDGSHGLVFDTDRAAGDHSAGSKAINLWISSKGRSGDVGHGVVLKATVHLESMFIGYFRGDGVNIHTGLGTNANGFYVERVQVAQCGRDLDVRHLTFQPIKGTLGEFRLGT